MSLTNSTAVEDTAKAIIANGNPDCDLSADPDGTVENIKNMVQLIMEHIQTNGEIDANMPVGTFSTGASPVVIVSVADVPVTGGSIT